MNKVSLSGVQGQKVTKTSFAIIFGIFVGFLSIVTALASVAVLILKLGGTGISLLAITQSIINGGSIVLKSLIAYAIFIITMAIIVIYTIVSSIKQMSLSGKPVGNININLPAGLAMMFLFSFTTFDIYFNAYIPSLAHTVCLYSVLAILVLKYLYNIVYAVSMSKYWVKSHKKCNSVILLTVIGLLLAVFFTVAGIVDNGGIAFYLNFDILTNIFKPEFLYAEMLAVIEQINNIAFNFGAVGIQGLFTLLGQLLSIAIFIEILRVVASLLFTLITFAFDRKYYVASKYFRKTGLLGSAFRIVVLKVLIFACAYLLGSGLVIINLLNVVVPFAVIVILLIVISVINKKMKKLEEDKLYLLDNVDEEYVNEDMLIETANEDAIKETADEETTEEEPIEDGEYADDVEGDEFIDEDDEADETEDAEDVEETAQNYGAQNQQPQGYPYPQNGQIPPYPYPPYPIYPQGYPYPQNGQIPPYPYPPYPNNGQPMIIYVPVNANGQPIGQKPTPQQPINNQPKPKKVPVVDEEDDNESSDFNIVKKTLDEKIADLKSTERRYYTQIMDYASKKEGVRRNKSTFADTVTYGRDCIVKTKIKNGKIVCSFSFANYQVQQMLNGTTAKSQMTTVKVVDAQSYSLAKQSIDMAYKCALEAKEMRHQEQLKKRREARKENK